DHIRWQILRLPRRPHPPPDPADGKAADGILLRHRSEAGGRVARQDAGHAGGQQDRRDILSLPVAGLWPRRQIRRGLSLYRGADADDPLKRAASGGGLWSAPRKLSLFP